jgi:hypothetical protein
MYSPRLVEADRIEPGLDAGTNEAHRRARFVDCPAVTEASH